MHYNFELYFTIEAKAVAAVSVDYPLQNRLLDENMSWSRSSMNCFESILNTEREYQQLISIIKDSKSVD